jgi:hypothetical protein
MTDPDPTYQLVEGTVHPHVDDAVLHAVTRAVIEHNAATNDNARVTIAPLGRDESLWMAGLYDHVAAYLMVTVDEFRDGSDQQLRATLGQRLSDVELRDVEYEIVWAKKRSLLLYVRGALAT